MTVTTPTQTIKTLTQASLALGCFCLTLASSQAGVPLTAGEPLLLEKTQGRFDFLRVDSAKHRLLLTHYDPESHLAYCASGQGKISVVKMDGEKLTTVGDVPSASGCHSIVIDPKTHTVWIAYAKGDQSFAQPFTAER